MYAPDICSFFGAAGDSVNSPLKMSMFIILVLNTTLCCPFTVLYFAIILDDSFLSLVSSLSHCTTVLSVSAILFINQLAVSGNRKR